MGGREGQVRFLVAENRRVFRSPGEYTTCDGIANRTRRSRERAGPNVAVMCCRSVMRLTRRNVLKYHRSGRRAGLKILSPQGGVGSRPTFGTELDGSDSAAANTKGGDGGVATAVWAPPRPTFDVAVDLPEHSAIP